MNKTIFCAPIPDNLTLEAITRLTARTYLLTSVRLEGYGNRLTDPHKDAVHQLAHEFSRLVFGLKEGRYAYPLPTGMGKTQTVVCFCTALVLEGFDDKSVVVSATKVEALASIKRDLIANGVPEDRIGLIHSYDHDPSLPRDSLPEGYASEPSTAENDERQIMLVTHNRIKGGNLDRFNWYQGQPRNLVIWDESLLVSKSRMVSAQAVKKSLGHLAPDLPTDSPAVRYFESVLQAVEQELDRQRSGSEPRRLELPRLDNNLLHEIRVEVGQAEVQEPLHRFLEMIGESLRVIENPTGQAVIAYDIVIPEALKSVAVLDASYPIRELERMDKTIQLGCDFPTDLKRFDRVRLHHLKSPSGRNSLEKSFKQAKRTDRKISREICDLIPSLPVNDGIIIFTFKSRGTGIGRGCGLNITKIIRSDLEATGVDTKATLPEGDRIVFLTWGQETSLSQYSYCKHVIFAGVLHRDELQLISEMVAQRNDLYGRVTRTAIEEVVTSEIAHGLYQAISRGCCRIVEGNQALPMDVWLIHGSENVRPMLETAMPGLQWLPWRPKYLVNDPKLREALEAITRHLGCLPHYIDTVSTQTLRKVVGADIHRNYFTKALEMVLETEEGWERWGRGIKRQEPDYAEAFREAA